MIHKNDYQYYIWYIHIRLGTKLYLKQSTLNFGPKLPKKGKKCPVCAVLLNSVAEIIKKEFPD